jgi:hypothetical protein
MEILWNISFTSACKKVSLILRATTASSTTSPALLSSKIVDPTTTLDTAVTGMQPEHKSEVIIKIDVSFIFTSKKPKYLMIDSIFTIFYSQGQLF